MLAALTSLKTHIIYHLSLADSVGDFWKRKEMQRFQGLRITNRVEISSAFLISSIGLFIPESVFWEVSIHYGHVTLDVVDDVSVSSSG